MQESFARLRNDPESWREYREEFALWETTSMDGLENEEPYSTDEETGEILEAEPSQME